jgi:ribosomal protein S18 acetylase RimI-like enzyme
VPGGFFRAWERRAAGWAGEMKVGEMPKPRMATAADAGAVANLIIEAEFVRVKYSTALIAGECEAEDWDIEGATKRYSVPLIVTKEELRRRGHARSLLRAAIDIAKSQSAELVAYPENQKSVELLESEGFLRVPSRSDECGYPLYGRREPAPHVQPLV